MCLERAEQPCKHCILWMGEKSDLLRMYCIHSAVVPQSQSNK